VIINRGHTMNIPYHEKINLPHAVYRFTREDGTLLYVGCSMRPLARAAHHYDTRPWTREIARVEIKWYPDFLSASRAERQAILDEAPLFNAAIFSVESVGKAMLRAAGVKKKGDGTTCPRCGGPKEHKPGKAYCQPCNRDYQEERRRRLGTRPQQPPTVTCPRCEGVKEVGRNYCRPCKKQVSAEYRASR
jgi:predicted GIY-YIG superfamily endonuclease